MILTIRGLDRNLWARFCVIPGKLCRYHRFSQCDAKRQPVTYSTVQYVPPKRVTQKEDLASVAIVADFVYSQCPQSCCNLSRNSLSIVELIQKNLRSFITVKAHCS